MLGSTIKVVVTDAEGNVIGEDETAEVALPEVAIKDVDQTGANEIVLTFDQDATGLVEKDDIKVAAADGTIDIPVNKLTLSDDGTEATVELAVNLTDGKDYKVSLNDSIFEFEASVGEVASISILTTQAEQNVKTDIEFVLLDENGTDVTSTVSASNLTVSIDGSYTAAETSNPLKANITMGTVKDIATITVTYNKNASELTEGVVGEGKIECIDPTATVGDGVFAQTDDVNLNSLSAKFYNGAKSASATVAEDETVNDVYFYAKDENGDAIFYDSYEVESSNEDIVTVSNPDKATGKFTWITLTGNKVGSANVNIKAIKNGVATPYMIPVTVTKQQEASNIKVSVNRSPISNAYDVDYKGKVTVNVVDSTGKASTDYASLEISEGSEENYQDPDKWLDKDAYRILNGNVAAGLGFDVDNASFSADDEVDTTYTAYGAKAATNYPIKVVLTKNDGKTVEKTINVTVRALPKEAYDLTGDGVKVTYGIELGKNVLDSAKEQYTTARVASYVNNIFAGYVRNDETATNGKIKTLIGSPLGYAAAVKGVGYIKAPGENKFVKITEKNGSDTNYTFAAADTLTASKTPVAATVEGTDEWVELTTETAANPGANVWAKIDANGYASFDGTTPGSVDVTSNGTYTQVALSDGNGFYYTKDGEITTATGHYVLLSAANTAVTSPTDEQTGYAAGRYAFGGTTINSTADTSLAQKYERTELTGTDAGTYYYTVSDTGTYVLAASATELVDDVTEAMTGYASKDQSLDIAADGETITLDWYADATAEEVQTLLNDTGLFDTEVTNTLPVGFEIAGTDIYSYRPGSDEDSGSGWLKVNDDYAITDVALGVKFGTLYATDGELYTVDKTVPAPVAEVSDENDLVILTAAEVLGRNLNWVVGDEAKSADFARTGSYTVFFTYKDKDSKDKTATNSLTVKNSFVIPKVTVTSREVDSLDEASVLKVLKANVDLNNDNGDNVSIVKANLAGTQDSPAGGWLFDEAAVVQDKLTVKYVVVEEDDVNFYINIGSTFHTAK